MKESRRRYTPLRNVLWGIQFSFNHEKAMWFYCLLIIAVEPFSSLAPGYLVRSLINSLEGNSALYTVIKILALGTLIIICLRILKDVLQDRIRARMLSVSFLLQGKMYEFKNDRLLYQTTLTKRFLKNENDAGLDASMNGGSLDQALVNDIRTFGKALVGLGFCTALITQIDVYLLLIILLTSFLSFLPMRWHDHYYEMHKDNWARETRLMRYMDALSRRLAEAKDIRLFGMQEWLLSLMKESH